jgi:hypothetical protein
MKERIKKEGGGYFLKPYNALQGRKVGGVLAHERSDIHSLPSIRSTCTSAESCLRL